MTGAWRIKMLDPEQKELAYGSPFGGSSTPATGTL